MTTREEIAEKLMDMCTKSWNRMITPNQAKVLIDLIESEIAAAEKRARVDVASNIWRVGTTEGINAMRKYIKHTIAENSEPTEAL